MLNLFVNIWWTSRPHQQTRGKNTGIWNGSQHGKRTGSWPTARTRSVQILGSLRSALSSWCVVAGNTIQDDATRTLAESRSSTLKVTLICVWNSSLFALGMMMLLLSLLVGALRPDNHKGLHQGWKKTNFSRSPSYSFHKLLYHKSLFLKPQLRFYKFWNANQGKQ